MEVAHLHARRLRRHPVQCVDRECGRHYGYVLAQIRILRCEQRHSGDHRLINQSINDQLAHTHHHHLFLN